MFIIDSIITQVRYFYNKKNRQKPVLIKKLSIKNINLYNLHYNYIILLVKFIF